VNESTHSLEWEEGGAARGVHLPEHAKFRAGQDAGKSEPMKDTQQ